jgi:anti-anti-sigma factor
MDGTLRTKVVYDAETMVASMFGEMDAGTCPQAQAIFDAVNWRDVDRLQVDLRNVAFMDSSGLHFLLRLRDSASKHGVPLTIVQGPQCVQRVFELTGTVDVFTWIDDPVNAARRHRSVAVGVDPRRAGSGRPVLGTTA